MKKRLKTIGVVVVALSLGVFFLWRHALNQRPFAFLYGQEIVVQEEVEAPTHIALMSASSGASTADMLKQHYRVYSFRADYDQLSAEATNELKQRGFDADEGTPQDLLNYSRAFTRTVPLPVSGSAATTPAPSSGLDLYESVLIWRDTRMKPNKDLVYEEGCITVIAQLVETKDQQSILARIMSWLGL